MQALASNWLNHQVNNPKTLRSKGVMLYSVGLTLKIILISSLISVVGHILIDSVGLLPYPLTQAITVGLFLTIAITSIVGLAFSYIISNTILMLSTQRDTFEHSSNYDELSGLRNRRSFFENYEKYRQAGGLMLIDVDNFKDINDEFGHVVGDEVIRSIGHTLGSVFSQKEIIVGRVGGEEFAAYVPATSDRYYGELAEVACQTVCAMKVNGVSRPVTISVGVADNYPSRSVTEVYSIADRALYIAKKDGKNRVVIEEMLKRENGSWP